MTLKGSEEAAGETLPPSRVFRRIERTFGFVDLCGFTSHNALVGDDEAGELLMMMRSIIREASAYHGTPVDTWLGDGARLVGEDPCSVVMACLEIVALADLAGLPLPLRGAVASGEVVDLDGLDYVGSSVNLAARLMDVSDPHTVMVPASLTSVRHELAASSTSRTVRLPSFTSPVQVHSLHPRTTGLVPVGGPLYETGRRAKDVSVLLRRMWEGESW